MYRSVLVSGFIFLSFSLLGSPTAMGQAPEEAQLNAKLYKQLNVLRKIAFKNETKMRKMEGQIDLLEKKVTRVGDLIEEMVDLEIELIKRIKYLESK